MVQTLVNTSKSYFFIQGDSILKPLGLLMELCSIIDKKVSAHYWNILLHWRDGRLYFRIDGIFSNSEEMQRPIALCQWIAVSLNEPLKVFFVYLYQMHLPTHDLTIFDTLLTLELMFRIYFFYRAPCFTWPLRQSTNVGSMTESFPNNMQYLDVVM